MLELLRNYLHLHRISFAYLDPRADYKEKRTILEDFSTKNNFLALLTSPKAASNSSRRCFNGFTDICNVVFFDSANNGNGNVDYTETLEWCQTFNGVTSLRVYKLVCEDTVEDSLSIQALQKSLGPHSVATNAAAENQQSSSSTSTSGLNFETNLTEPICKIKKHALEALFNTHFAGDNGVLSGKNVRFFLKF